MTMLYTGMIVLVCNVRIYVLVATLYVLARVRSNKMLCFRSVANVK
jgi:hypothetical protein